MKKLIFISLLILAGLQSNILQAAYPLGQGQCQGLSISGGTLCGANALCTGNGCACLDNYQDSGDGINCVSIPFNNVQNVNNISDAVRNAANQKASQFLAKHWLY